MKKESRTNVAVKLVEKTVLKVADFYAGIMCNGRWYEPKMPEKLKK